MAASQLRAVNGPAIAVNAPATFAIVYNPAAKTPSRNNLRQVGAYTAAGAVDKTASLIGDNVGNLSKAIAANWLALHGREGDLSKVVGSNPFWYGIRKISGV